MDILVNDLSVHEQFHEIPTFREAFERLWEMRGIARTFQRELLCNRLLASRCPLPDQPMYQAVNAAFGRNKNKLRVISSWLSKAGPFWDEDRAHSTGDYLEHSGDIVTDHALGEAAMRELRGNGCGLISATPSDWELSPISVTWFREAEDCPNEHASVQNWWSSEALRNGLKQLERPVRSWSTLRRIAKCRFTSLTFASNCFSPLDGVPFKKCSAERLQNLLAKLNEVASAVDVRGARTAEGHRLYREYFKGNRAWFSDSSSSEKDSFHAKMTFDHPDAPGQKLFCPWHGKESHLTLRMHFSWSTKPKAPVYVVYIGPKITKR